MMLPVLDIIASPLMLTQRLYIAPATDSTMSKRSLSPEPLESQKRCQVQSPSVNHTHISRHPFSFRSLYDELILLIFSFLSWEDLSAAQRVNKTCYRLAGDNELWRLLYIRNFGRTRLQGSRGFITGPRPDGREVKPLPGRALLKPDNAVKDWKWMFRIGSNWKKGRCAIGELVNDGITSIASTSPEDLYAPHVVLAGNLTITASSHPSANPSVHIFGHPSATHTITYQPKLSQAAVEITAISFDQAPPTRNQLRLAYFLSTGEFSVHSIHPTHLHHSSHIVTYLPRSIIPKDARVTRAVYHHPLLITLSRNFRLTIYDLSEDGVKLSQKLSSFTSFPPTSLVLSAPTTDTYKLVLAYTVPVYPEHWSVGATELIISRSKPVSISELGFVEPSTSSTPALHLNTPLLVVSSRTTKALDVPPGWIDERKLRVMREQWSRRVLRVADTQTDGKWVVLAPADAPGNWPPPSSSGNTSSSSLSSSDSEDSDSSRFMRTSPVLQLYRLYLPPPSASVAGPVPRLTFVRNLHGQIGPISSLALSDGRCISLGLNGSLWVWDLEAGTGAEVSPASLDPMVGGRIDEKGTVTFDDRRIVSTHASKVYVRRFDI